MAQSEIVRHRMNVEIIDREKNLSIKVLRMSNIKKNILKQMAKVDWLKLGDGNNNCFHASLKSRHKHNNITTMEKEDGSIIIKQEEVCNEVLQFYGKLVGTDATDLKGINIVAMREGKQISTEQGQ